MRDNKKMLNVTLATPTNIIKCDGIRMDKVIISLSYRSLRL
jgi:hypothetical protein